MCCYLWFSQYPLTTLIKWCIISLYPLRFHNFFWLSVSGKQTTAACHPIQALHTQKLRDWKYNSNTNHFKNTDGRNFLLFIDLLMKVFSIGILFSMSRFCMQCLYGRCDTPLPNDLKYTILAQLVNSYIINLISVVISSYISEPL